MKPVPRSSLTFCSGVLVIGFVSWAWRDSMLYNSSLRWNCFMAENENGGIQVNSAYSFSGFSAGRSAKLFIPEASYAPAVAMPLFLKGSGGPNSPAGYPDLSSYRGTLETMMKRRAPEAWLVFIPHWLLLLAAALPWTGLMYWRARRRKRSGQDAQAITGSAQSLPGR